MDVINEFKKIILALSYQNRDDRIIPLTNLTFFCGAGFSKTWDMSFPIGDELFQLKLDLSLHAEAVSAFINSIGYDTTKIINASQFKDIIYQLSMQLKYPSLRTRYMDEENLNQVYNQISYLIQKRFTEISNLNFIKDISERLTFKKKTKNQKEILKFFAWLTDHSTGSNNIPEGLRINFLTTNYDFVIETILNEILYEDDDFSLYCYRGFTPTMFNSERPPTVVHEHFLVEQLIKINGGFEIMRDAKNKFMINYIKRNEEEIISNPPLLILPNREQDYTNIYFQTIFPKAIRLLQESKILIIIGASFPEEDSLLRILLRQFAEDKIDCLKKRIFYISPMNQDLQIKKMESVFPYLKIKHLSPQIFYYSGTFNDFITDTLKRLK